MILEREERAVLWYDKHCGWFQKGNNEYNDVTIMRQGLANTVY